MHQPITTSLMAQRVTRNMQLHGNEPEIHQTTIWQILIILTIISQPLSLRWLLELIIRTKHHHSPWFIMNHCPWSWNCVRLSGQKRTYWLISVAQTWASSSEGIYSCNTHVCVNQDVQSTMETHHREWSCTSRKSRESTHRNYPFSFLPCTKMHKARTY